MSKESDSCMRGCCGNQRGFQIFILDNSQNQVMKVSREFKCFTGCCWCAGICDHCDILDENHESILKIEGPCCVLDGACFPCENEFKVTFFAKFYVQ